MKVTKHASGMFYIWDIMHISIKSSSLGSMYVRMYYACVYGVCVCMSAYVCVCACVCEFVCACVLFGVCKHKSAANVLTSL